MANAETRNSIYQFNAYCHEGTHYEIQQWSKTIKIIQGFADPAKRFQFAARTEEYQGGQWVDIGPGTINLVRIHEDVPDPGTVILEISGSPPYPTGAIDVKKINLPTSQTAYSRIWWIRIQGDLGIDGLSDFDRIDLIEVDGDLYDSLWSIGDITNSVTIGGHLLGDITGGHMTGSTTIGSLSGQFNVTGAGLLGPLHVTGNVTDDGVIFVKGSCTKAIDIDGNFGGSLSIGWEEDHDLRAPLTIDGLCSGDITITRLYSDPSDQGSIYIGQDCTGDT
jgi:hypothetical protein